jgi:hypothetical protein
VGVEGRPVHKLQRQGPDPDHHIAMLVAGTLPFDIPQPDVGEWTPDK